MRAAACAALRSTLRSHAARHDSRHTRLRRATAGRAGRLEPGVCYRLWTEREQAIAGRPSAARDVRRRLDLAGLGVGALGNDNPAELSWLTAPPTGSVTQASDLLIRLGRWIHGTHHHPWHSDGRAGAASPPLAHVAASRALGPRRPGLRSCRPAGRARPTPGSGGTTAREPTSAPDSMSCTDSMTIPRASPSIAGCIIASSARQRCGGDSSFAGRSKPPRDRPGINGASVSCSPSPIPTGLANGKAGHDDTLRAGQWTRSLSHRRSPARVGALSCIAEFDGGTQWATIELAAPVSQAEIETLYADQIVETEAVNWDEKTHAVQALRQRRLGGLILSQAQPVQTGRRAHRDRAYSRGVSVWIDRPGLDAGIAPVASARPVPQADRWPRFTLAGSVR